MLEGRSFEREPIYYLNIEMNTHTCTSTHTHTLLLSNPRISARVRYAVQNAVWGFSDPKGKPA